MTDKNQINVNDKIFEKLTKLKNAMGFKDKDWNNWFDDLITEIKDDTTSTIELIFKKNVYEKFYDVWIQNFASNLNNIWNDHSVRELSLNNTTANGMPSIVIGRGPSLFEKNHLKILSESRFDGNIICTDGVLIKALESGVTPEKFKNFYVVTIDAQDHIKEFYNNDIVSRYGNKINCIFSSTISPETYNVAKNNKMKIFWLHALFDYNKTKTSFNYMANIMTKTYNHEKGLPAIQTGGNVGTSSWMIAWSILKSPTIVLLGIDHGYPDTMSWDEIDKYHKIPSDVDKTSKSFKNAYPTIYNPDFDCYCKQDPIFQYYSKALIEFIPRAPSWVNTINATGGGSIFGSGITCMNFKKYLEKNNF